jgi:hypothetical protein
MSAAPEIVENLTVAAAEIATVSEGVRANNERAAHFFCAQAFVVHLPRTNKRTPLHGQECSINSVSSRARGLFTFNRLSNLERGENTQPAQLSPTLISRLHTHFLMSFPMPQDVAPVVEAKQPLDVVEAPVVAVSEGKLALSISFHFLRCRVSQVRALLCRALFITHLVVSG